MHLTEVSSLSHRDVVTLKNGYAIATDIVIHCTGFNKGYEVFDNKLQQELGLGSVAPDTDTKWAEVYRKAEESVDELLPFLQRAPVQSQYSPAVRQGGPNRHYRRLVAPRLAARDDRSIIFPGHVHSAFTPLVAELQGLWGITWMLGWRDLPSQELMEMEAAKFNAWTRKRYLEQGMKHSYFIYDYLPVS